jgi:hypothetical protein
LRIINSGQDHSNIRVVQITGLEVAVDMLHLPFNDSVVDFWVQADAWSYYGHSSIRIEKIENPACRDLQRLECQN